MVRYNAEKEEYENFLTSSTEYLADKRVIVIGIPTPFCPEYEDEMIEEWARCVDDFKEEMDFDEVILSAPIDPYVAIWYARYLGCAETFTYLADWDVKFGDIMEN